MHEELNVGKREKEEAYAEQKLAEAHQHQALFVKEQWEDREQRVVYRFVFSNYHVKMNISSTYE